MDTRNPHERMKAEREQQAREQAEMKARAISNPYAIVKVSDRRWRVIRIASFGGYNVRGEMQPIAMWSFVTPPLGWEEVHEEIAKLRTPLQKAIQNMMQQGE